MDSLDFSLSPTNKRGSPRKGRRAGTSEGLGATDDSGGFAASSVTSSPGDMPTSAPPPVGRRAGGWATSAKAGDARQTFEDKRLQRDSDSDNDLPLIPDLDEVVEEDFTQQIANAPSIAVNRVATYKELDSDLLRHAAFSTLDDIDLRLLTAALTSEVDIREPDVAWQWDRLFTEISSELHNEWDPSDITSEQGPSP